MEGILKESRSECHLLIFFSMEGGRILGGKLRGRGG